MVDYQMMYRLRILKEKLKKQRQHLDELDAHMYVPCYLTPHLHTQFIPTFMHHPKLYLTNPFVTAMLSPENKVVSTISNVSSLSKARFRLLHSSNFFISVDARKL